MYGWLRRDKGSHGWMGGHGGGSVTLFEYGYPARTVDNGVTGQWLFDEGSGAIVDEVNAVSLAVTSTPTFDVSATGEWANLSPGITYANGKYHSVAGNVATMDIGTSDFVLEWVCTTSESAATVSYVIDTRQAAGDFQGYYVYLFSNGATQQVVLNMKTTDNTTDTVTWNTDIASLGDGVIRKFRITGDRDGNAILTIDDDAQTVSGSADISALDTKTLDTNNLFMGERITTGSSLKGTLYELRLTLDNLFANSSATPKDYGYPSTGREEDVIAHWLFDESAASLTDKIGSVALTDVGAPVYGVDTSAYSPTMGRGVTYDGTANRSQNTSDQAAWDLGGSDDFTIEWVAKAATGYNGLHYFFTINGDTDNADFGIMAYYNGATLIAFNFKADDGTAWSDSFTVDSVDDGLYHKWRTTWDRSGNMELFIDEVSQGTSAISSLDGKAITNRGIKMCGQYNNGDADWKGTMVEWRWSRNLTNDSGMSDYGYPNKGVEPDVAAQWLFEEPDTAVVDQVTAMTLPEVGTVYYSKALTGSWANLSPGVGSDDVTNGDGWLKAGVEAQLDFDQLDAVVEWVGYLDSAATTGANEVLNFQELAGTGQGLRIVYDQGNKYISTVMKSTDDTAVTVHYSVPDMRDDLVHKWRMVFDRSGDLTVYIDGESKTVVGSADISSLSAKDVKCNRVALLNNPGSKFGWEGSMGEIRITIGNLTNNSGGPGGG